LSEAYAYLLVYQVRALSLGGVEILREGGRRGERQGDRPCIRPCVPHVVPPGMVLLLQGYATARASERCLPRRAPLRDWRAAAWPAARPFNAARFCLVADAGPACASRRRRGAPGTVLSPDPKPSSRRVFR